MDFIALYHFLFETFEGIGILIGTVLIICLIACFAMEWNTRRKFKDRGPSPDEDDWSFFDDDEEGGR